MFKKYFLIFICLTFFSCKKNTYEYITKDKTFRDSIQTGFFTELSHGFTYYEIDNRKSEDVIVFIHGYSVPLYIWDKTYNSAKEKGFKVIRIDLYGRGYSENPIAEYSDSLFANQVIELLDELEIENVSFIGLSNGGRVITKVADLKPNIVNKLVYVSSSSFGEHIEIKDKSVSELEISNFIENNYPTISKSQLSDFKHPENYPKWDDKYETLLKYKGFARALISTRKNHVNLDFELKEISDSNMKVYTIWGDSDSVVVYDKIKDKLNKLIPNRFEYIVPNSGHLPHIENSKNFEEYLFDVVLN